MLTPPGTLSGFSSWDRYHTLPPNPRLLDYITYPLKVPESYMRRLIDNFGGHFTLVMVSVYFGIKGIMFALLNGSMLAYFKTYLGVDGAAYQAYGTVACMSSRGLRVENGDLGGARSLPPCSH